VTRDYRDYLDDILTSIDETAEFTADMSFESFTVDRKTVNAVVRSLEVIGEAAKVSRRACALKPPVCPGSTWPGCVTN